MSDASKMKICSSCRKEVDVKARRCPYCRSKLGSWFWRHPILTVFGAMFFFFIMFVAAISSAVPTEPTTDIQARIPYEVVWDNSANGHIWKSIVVDEQYLNDDSMTTLGKQLHSEYGGNVFAKVAVFKTEESAALFAEAQADPFSKKLDDGYDEDFVALYSLNSNTNYEEFSIHLGGLGTESNTRAY